MPTTTPNFGWSVPVSTDLVKDGATAIELLGDSIDASLVDLKGGTTGQVLAKASNTDMDFSWVAQDDSNAIQNAIVDAKGDIIAATANDTPARLAVGANDTVLTADSSTATGLKWATPGAASAPAFQAYLGSNQTGMQDSVAEKLKIDTEVFDSDSWFNTTNYRYTPQKAGYYQFTIRGSSSLIHTIYVYKNGSTQFNAIGYNSNQSFPGSSMVYMNGSSDYVELWGLVQTANGSFNSGASSTSFEGFWVRP